LATSILQRFLDHGLLNIGEDDDRFDRLQKAAADLERRILSAPERIIPYTIVALDPDVPTDDPVFAEVHTAIVGHWNTYRSRFADSPRQLYRAVLLEALASATTKDDAAAGAFALTAANVIPRVAAATEAEVWEAIISDARRAVETRAASEWTGDYATPTFELPAIEITSPKVGKISTKKLSQALRAAAGPTGEGEQNPHWPSNPNPWADEFGPRAAAAIAHALNDVLSDVAEAAGKTGEHFAAAADGFAEALRTGFESLARAAAGAARRTQLLWWKEALYSPLAEAGYRTLDHRVATVLMAIDLHALVPPFAPASVEHVLRETVREVIGSNTNSTTTTASLEEVCVAVSESQHAAEIQTALGEPITAAGRGSFIDVLTLVALGRPAANEFRARVGVEAAVSLPLDDIGVWIFRELQARRLTAAIEQVEIGDSVDAAETIAETTAV
jgi:hypothetical protein